MKAIWPDSEPRASIVKCASFLIFLAAAFSLEALAMPQYSLKEHKQCVYCHFDPKGGGPTNAAGRYYAEHFTLEGYRDKKKSKKIKKKPKKTKTAASPEEAE